MATTRARRNVSVSLPTDLVDVVDAWAGEAAVTRSAFLTRLIRVEERRRFEEQLEREYRELTEAGSYDDIEFYFPAQREAVMLAERELESEATDASASGPSRGHLLG